MPTFRDYLSAPSSRVEQSWRALPLGTTGSPYTSGENRISLRTTPEGLRVHFNRGVNIKSPIVYITGFTELVQWVGPREMTRVQKL